MHLRFSFRIVLLLSQNFLLTMLFSHHLHNRFVTSFVALHQHSRGFRKNAITFRRLGSSMFVSPQPKSIFCRSMNYVSRKIQEVPSFCNSATTNSILSYSKSTKDTEEKENTEKKGVFGHSIPFSELNLHPLISSAMTSLEFPISTDIQAKSIPVIMEEEDIIIGSETGSGKTLAYVLPLLSKYFYQLENGADRSEAFEFPDTIILVPNRQLCEQVLSMTHKVLNCIHTLESQDKKKIINVVFSTTSEWPFRQGVNSSPFLLVTTPAFLAGFHREMEVFENVNTLVIDEADMLLEGDYGKMLDKIMVGFKRVDKLTNQENEMILKQLEARKETENNMNEEIEKKWMAALRNKTQYILAAATIPTYGLKSIQKLIKKVFPKAEVITTDFMHKHHPLLSQEFIFLDNEYQLKLNKVLELLTDGKKVEGQLVDYDDPVNFNIDPANKEAKGSMASFIEVDHTMTEDKNSSKDSLNEEYKAENESNPTSSKEIKPKIEPIKINQKTMIFTNTVMEAKYLLQDLILNGVRAVPYHKEMSMKDRAFSLEAFRQSEKTKANVMVCTDLASRGIDVPDVEHVIQFDFATNVVMHLHRIGRAVRGGRNGRATNLYGKLNKDLVDSIQAAEDGKNGELDQTFSRQRGFRKKIKKYGRSYYGLTPEVDQV